MSSSPSSRGRRHTLTSYTQVMHEHTQKQMDELRAPESPPEVREAKKPEGDDVIKHDSPQGNGLPPSIKKHDYAQDNAQSKSRGHSSDS
ncbi:hypothetical protein FQN49_005257 [Arthroderma sp. PD_2]|nr:hypothetical protein FQN49_005257 [Arthroderma sp. PD_2]